MSRCLPIALVAAAVFSLDAAAVELIPNKQLSLYGRLAADLYLADDGENSSVGVASGDSYIGFAGRHNLPEEYRLVWQIEQVVNLDEGGSAFATSNTFIAVQKRAIEVLVGRYDSPFLQALEPIVHLPGTFADIRGIMGSSPFSPTANTFDMNASNVLQVTWRANENIDVIGFYSGDTSSANVGLDDDNDGRLNAIAVFFKQGPLHIRGAWQDQEVDDASGIRLVGEYEMDEITLGGAFESTSSDALSTPDRSAIALNGKLRWKPNTDLIGQLVFANEDEVDDSGAMQLSAGVVHRVDPKLELYGVFALMQNDDNAAYSLGYLRSDLAVPGGTVAGPAAIGGTLPGKGGEDPIAIAVGAVFEF